MTFSPWSFETTPEAREEIENLSAPVRMRILKKLKWFAKNFENTSPLPLHNEWKGFFKLRIGDWRVIYQCNSLDRCITINHVDHRSRIYRR